MGRLTFASRFLVEAKPSCLFSCGDFQRYPPVDHVLHAGVEFTDSLKAGLAKILKIVPWPSEPVTYIHPPGQGG